MVNFFVLFFSFLPQFRMIGFTIYIEPNILFYRFKFYTILILYRFSLKLSFKNFFIELCSIYKSIIIYHKKSSLVGKNIYSQRLDLKNLFKYSIEIENT